MKNKLYVVLLFVASLLAAGCMGEDEDTAGNDLQVGDALLKGDMHFAVGADFRAAPRFSEE